jgi:hypothetical protein
MFVITNVSLQTYNTQHPISKSPCSKLGLLFVLSKLSGQFEQYEQNHQKRTATFGNHLYRVVRLSCYVSSTEKSKGRKYGHKQESAEVQQPLGRVSTVDQPYLSRR